MIVIVIAVIVMLVFLCVFLCDACDFFCDACVWVFWKEEQSQEPHIQSQESLTSQRSYRERQHNEHSTTRSEPQSRSPQVPRPPLTQGGGLSVFILFSAPTPRGGQLKLRRGPRESALNRRLMSNALRYPCVQRSIIVIWLGSSKHERAKSQA